MWLTVLLLLALGLACSTKATAAPTVDQSFGSGGFVHPTVFPRNKKAQTARDVAFQSDGKIVVPMTLPIPYGHRARRPVIRLNPDGTRDKSYGRDGVAWIRASGAPFITLRGAKTMPGDGTLIWGEYFFKDRYSPGGFFVAKVSASGVVDKSFGDRGSHRFTLNIPGNDTELVDVSPASDGGVIASINTFSLKHRRDTVRVTRLTPAGTIDKSFGTDGTKKLPLSRKTMLTGYARGVAVSGNSLYLSVDVKTGCMIRRYALSGTVPLDGGFGMSGRASAGPAVSGQAGSTCSGLGATSTGGLLVFGETGNEKSGPQGFVQRLKFDGSIDPVFGPNGFAALPTIQSVSRAVELSGGGVLASGGCGDVENFKGCLAVVDATGSSATSFGTAGTLTLGKYDFGTQLAAGMSSAAALIMNDSSKSYEQTHILKLAN